MSKHILVVSQYFYPEQFRINDICKEWVKRGYKVTVLTGIPNYPEGKFYKGYGWTKKRKESWNGMDIIRIPIIARGHSAIGMVFNYVSFVISGYFWKVFTKVKADCVFTFEVSPMTQALIGVWYSKKHKIPNYLYVQDLWPENVEIVTGIHSKIIINPINKMVNYIYKNCSKIFVTSPSFVKEIQNRIDDKEKVIYWPQYAEEFYKPVQKRAISEIPNDGRFKIAFTGNIGKAQGLQILPETAKGLRDNGIFDVCFVIVGNGRYKDQLVSEIAKNNVSDMFIMIDHQPAEQIPKILGACDASFVSFMDNPLFEKTIPAKLQSYMACGMPIIASAKGETERIIKEAGCGICSPLGDAASLVKAIVEIREQERLQIMAKASRSYYERYFEKEKLLNFIDKYLNKNEII